MIQKQITYFGQQTIVACDGRCDKAWGVNGRPEHRFQPEDVDPDDTVYLADSVLGTAPADTGSWEGGHGKPSDVPNTDGASMNKWCVRECERSVKVDVGTPIVLRDMERPTPNQPWKHPGYIA